MASCFSACWPWAKRPASAQRRTSTDSRGKGSNRQSFFNLSHTKKTEGNKSNAIPKGPSVLDKVLRVVGSRKEEPLAAMSEWMEKTADPQVVSREAIILVLVGLPARGKSFICGAVVRHLKLLGVRVRSFNAGELRRETGKAGIEADFFSSSNLEAFKERERLAMLCCQRLLEWIQAAPPGTSSIGILDATNTTLLRRQRVLETCFAAAQEAHHDEKSAPLRVIFLESLCSDPKILQDNYQMKLSNDDYKGAESSAALDDFKKRVEAYEAQYEPLQEGELDFTQNRPSDAAMPVGSVQIYDGGQKITCCRTGSSLVAAPLISLLHAMHLTRRQILLAPESNSAGQGLPPQSFVEILKNEEEKEGRIMDVICGASKHAVRIAQELSKVPSVPSASGVAAGAPRGRPRCVLNLRALQGRSADGAADGAATAESYADLVRRMRVEVLLLLERLPRSVLVICPGEDVRRVLFAHFCGCSEVPPLAAGSLRCHQPPSLSPWVLVPEIHCGPGDAQLGSPRAHAGPQGLFL
ncbi:unnamed protein product [Durusdinium trenchii]|uniref:6-phosphofructo-2-kinase domain-containing protein n=1 Tax=Durusdinium trenchii TaxID=1381693 RepID=A0ABP0SPM2_9DINO